MNNNQQPFNPFNSNVTNGLNKDKEFGTITTIADDEKAQEVEQQPVQPKEVKHPVVTSCVNIVLLILVLGLLGGAVYFITVYEPAHRTAEIKKESYKLDGHYPVGYYKVYIGEVKVALQYYWNPEDLNQDGYYEIYTNQYGVTQEGEVVFEMKSTRIQKVDINGDTHTLYYSGDDGELELSVKYNQDQTVTIQVNKNTYIADIDVLHNETLKIEDTL